MTTATQTPQPQTFRAATEAARRAATAPVVIMHAPPGVPAIRLAHLKTRDLRTVAFSPSMTENRSFSVANEILEALGKRLDVTGLPRKPIERAELVTVWLNAHRTQRLIATTAQWLAPKMLRDLGEMVQATPTQLVLGCDHGYVDKVREAAVALDPVVIDWPDLRDADDGFDQPTTTPAHSGPTGSSTLPTVEYWTFYATAKKRLSEEQFAHVDLLYRRTVTRLDTWLTTLGPNADRLTADLAYDSLKTLLEEQHTLDDVTVTLRATQAAYHRQGWLLDVDERELRNGLIRFPPSRTTPGTYETVRALFEPVRAATVALYLAGATPNDIQTVTVDDLAQWDHKSARLVANILVPDPAHPFLRAALLLAGVHGDHPDSPAFPGDFRRVLRDLRQAANDLGLNFGDANLDRKASLGARRIPQRILKLERLT